MPSLQSTTVGALVALMMLGVGLRVPLAAIRSVLGERALVARVLVVNVLAMPLVAVAITSLPRVPPAVTAAVLLCAAAPGGPLGPVLTGLAAADLPLATALMVILALVSVVTTPLVAALTVPDLGDARIETLPVLATVAAFQLLPLSVGMVVLHRRPTAAARLAGPAATGANVLLGLLVIGLVLTRGQVLLDLGLVGFLAMAAFVVTCMAAGDRLAAGRARRRAVTLTTGVRNLALALLLASAHLGAPAVDAALLAFAVVMLGLPTIAALRWRRLHGTT
jgi:BASS family bile acid:Na+ symporter